MFLCSCFISARILYFCQSGDQQVSVYWQQLSIKPQLINIHWVSLSSTTKIRLHFKTKHLLCLLHTRLFAETQVQTTSSPVNAVSCSGVIIDISSVLITNKAAPAGPLGANVPADMMQSERSGVNGAPDGGVSRCFSFLWAAAAAMALRKQRCSVIGPIRHAASALNDPTGFSADYVAMGTSCVQVYFLPAENLAMKDKIVPECTTVQCDSVTCGFDLFPDQFDASVRSAYSIYSLY